MIKNQLRRYSSALVTRSTNEAQQTNEIKMKMENDRIKKMGKVTKKMMLNWQVISNKSRTSVVITA